MNRDVEMITRHEIHQLSIDTIPDLSIPIGNRGKETETQTIITHFAFIYLVTIPRSR